MMKGKTQSHYEKLGIVKVGFTSSGEKADESGRNKNGKPYTYIDVHFDDDGWADANNYLPKDYDLLTMMCEDGKCYSGWHNGVRFEGYRLPDDGVVKYWKKHCLNIHH